MATQAEGDLAGISRALQCTEEVSSSSRNLVVCIDGTSNRFGMKNTNIVELYSQVTKSNKQLTYYSSGLGTIAQVAGPSWRHRLSNGWDMAFGRNLHKVIMDSYRWLSDNYQDGDRVFLFGFSRGAYQVRALAGMIARVGLLLPGNNEQIPFAFELYSKTEDNDLSAPRRNSVFSQPIPKESKTKEEYTKLAKTFQKTFCRGNVQIHFVGVWDTVSSVGLSRNRTLPCTTTSCDHICYFRHALALDERRVKFLPEYVYGGRSSYIDDGHIKEVWFAGCHGDVGGGNRRNEKLQSGDVPLLWMRSEAVAAGLEVETADVMWKIDDLNKRITNSMSLGWWLLEVLPLKRLLYYDSDKHTRWPHRGGPRKILRGQKVHVSVLFKNNYKPYAQFFNNPEVWPAPMFWNDVASHQRLHGLSDLWEKDIFDEHSVQTLLDHLERGQPSVDVLDRLAFMSSFGVGKNTIQNYENAERILAAFLNHKDAVIRLSTAVTYCELGWEWPSGTHGERVRQIINDVPELLKSKEYRRACIYMPSLCKQTELMQGLINNVNLRKLVDFCDNTRIDTGDEETSSVAFHSAQALSILVKLDVELAQKLIDIQAVTDVTEALRLNCRLTSISAGNPALVSLLSVVDELAKHESARGPMKVGLIVPILLKLVKRYDDFVAPAAIRVLCSLLPDGELRRKMIRFEVLSILFDVLNRCSDETKQVACQALVKFAEHDDVQPALSQDYFLRKFAKQARSHKPSKRDGAILALVTLGNTQLRTAVREAIEAESMIPALVGGLDQKSTALSAASALARLVEIDYVADVVSDGSGASIVNMLRSHWFDGLHGGDGLQILTQLFECERLRTAVLNAGAVDVLSAMIRSERLEDVHAGLHYLRAVAQLDEDGSKLPNSDALNLVSDVVKALGVPRRRVQTIAMELLRSFSVEEDLLPVIIQGLLDLLKNRHAGVILAASTMLRFLSVNKPVRDQVLTEFRFWDLSHEYYEGLVDLDYGNNGRDPSKGEVYESVGRMIQLMQAHDDNDTGPNRTASGPFTAMPAEKRWFPSGPVPYELRKTTNKKGLATLLRCPPLLCSGIGR